jgi:hypothetical protein
MSDFDYDGWLEGSGLQAIEKVDYSSGASPKAFGRGPLAGIRQKRGIMTVRPGFQARNVSELSHQNRADLAAARSKDRTTPRNGRVRAGEVRQLNLANHARYKANKLEAKGKGEKAARINTRANAFATQTRGNRLAMQGHFGIPGVAAANVNLSRRIKQS